MDNSQATLSFPNPCSTNCATVGPCTSSWAIAHTPKVYVDAVSPNTLASRRLVIIPSMVRWYPNRTKTTKTITPTKTDASGEATIPQNPFNMARLVHETFTKATKIETTKAPAKLPANDSRTDTYSERTEVRNPPAVNQSPKVINAWARLCESPDTTSRYVSNANFMTIPPK